MNEGIFEVIKDYSNFKASPSNDSSATLIESVGQPSNASIISSEVIHLEFQRYLGYRLMLRMQYLHHHSHKCLVQQRHEAPHAIQVSLSTIVYFAIFFPS